MEITALLHRNGGNITRVHGIGHHTEKDQTARYYFIADVEWWDGSRSTRLEVAPFALVIDDQGRDPAAGEREYVKLSGHTRGLPPRERRMGTKRSRAPLDALLPKRTNQHRRPPMGQGPDSIPRGPHREGPTNTKRPELLPIEKGQLHRRQRHRDARTHQRRTILRRQGRPRPRTARTPGLSESTTARATTRGGSSNDRHQRTSKAPRDQYSPSAPTRRSRTNHRHRGIIAGSWMFHENACVKEAPRTRRLRLRKEPTR